MQIERGIMNGKIVYSFFTYFIQQMELSFLQQWFNIKVKIVLSNALTKRARRSENV